jgi:uncharacterized protein
MSSIKILSTSDVHQSKKKWDRLVDACKQEKPDIVAISGDLIHRDYMEKCMMFIEHTIIPSCEEMKKHCKEVLFIMGNDDPKEFEPYFMKEDKLWKCIDNKVVYLDDFKEIAFCGIPQVLDYPFRYKDWIVREDENDSRYDSYQLGSPMTYRYNHYREMNVDWKTEILKRPTFKDKFDELIPQVKDMSKSIWLIHCPPFGCGLDRCASGLTVGSKSITKFILDNQPLLTIHGHIHESPVYTNRWNLQMDKTWVVQAGQVEYDLHYVMIDIEDNKVKSMKHSIYDSGKSYTQRGSAKNADLPN